ncbi:MAG: hypothetical protein GY708_18960 [Actinomycetia bacterium]|nr:hypothetical protein [Actinomycetes bacterium]MCP4962370.1 hypothetical protein [Actinomycetes bacterium]
MNRTLWAALVLGLLAAVGVFVNDPGMSTLNSADDPANAEQVSLGPVILIDDEYGSFPVSCEDPSWWVANYSYSGQAPPAWGSAYAMVTSATPGSGLTFSSDPYIAWGTWLSVTVLAPNDDCDELAAGTVLASVEGTLVNGSTYEITITVA